MEIRAEGISRRFFRKSGQANFFYAVRETDLLVPAGSLTEITGRSGSGKSTLLNMLAGLLEPSSGRILYGGKDLYAMPDEERSAFRNRNIGVIPQGKAALPGLTVLENILLPARLLAGSGKGESTEPFRLRAGELMDRMGILSLKDAFPGELSGGEMRRLSIARALLMEPGVLFADEPTADLDDENTSVVFSLLKDIADRGTAVVLVTHEQTAAAYADRVLVMRDGRPEKLQTGKTAGPEKL